jgi:hypothetical protein
MVPVVWRCENGIAVCAGDYCWLDRCWILKASDDSEYGIRCVLNVIVGGAMGLW